MNTRTVQLWPVHMVLMFMNTSTVKYSLVWACTHGGHVYEYKDTASPVLACTHCGDVYEYQYKTVQFGPVHMVVMFMNISTRQSSLGLCTW